MSDAMDGRRCEGRCEPHGGRVRRVRVEMAGNPLADIEFDYCDEAIREDRRRGFTVTEIESRAQCEGNVWGTVYGLLHYAAWRLPMTVSTAELGGLPTDTENAACAVRKAMRLVDSAMNDDTVGEQE